MVPLPIQLATSTLRKVIKRLSEMGGYAQTVKESVQQARPIVDAAKHLGRPQRTEQILEAQ